VWVWVCGCGCVRACMDVCVGAQCVQCIYIIRYFTAVNWGHYVIDDISTLIRYKGLKRLLCVYYYNILCDRSPTIFLYKIHE